MNKIKLKFNWTKVLDNLIEINYLLIFFLLPLAMALFFKTNNVFELNKLVVFRSLTGLLAVLTLAKILWTGRFYKFSPRYLWPVLGFLIFWGLSLFLSIDSVNSFYGSGDRLQGYSSLLFYGLCWILLLYNLLTAENLSVRLKKIGVVVLGSSLIVSLYGILQILGIDFIAWNEAPFNTHRTTATLGQPNYLGSYLLLTMPLAWLGMIKGRGFWLRFCLALLMSFQLVCLVLTGSRAAWLGLIFALMVFAYFIFRRYLPKFNQKQRRRLWLSLSGVLVVAILFLSQSSYVVSRIKGMTDFGSGSVSARLNFWQASWDSFLERPFWGYGLENQGERIGRYYQSDWALTGFVNATTNRSHNIVLDILLTGGIIGLVFYVWLYGSFFRQGIKLHRNKDWGLGAEILLVLASSYLVSLFFGFAVVTTEVYFWAALAIMAAISIKSKSSDHRIMELKIRPYLKWLLLVGVLVLFVCHLGRELRVLRADSYYWQMRQNIAQGDYAQALFSYQKIKMQNIYNPEYRYYLVDSLPYDLDKSLNPLISKLYQQELSRILEEIKTETFDDVYTRAKIYSLLSNRELAEGDYDWLIAFAPEMPKNYLNRGRFYALVGENKKAIEDFNKALSLLPDPVNQPAALSTLESVVWHYRSIVYRNLADTYFAQGNYALAGDNYFQAYRHNLFDAASYKKIADCYFMQGDLDKAIWYNLRGAERHPQDYIWPLGAAILYQEQGQDDLALKYLNQALVLDSNKQIPAALVEKIKAGKK